METQSFITSGILEAYVLDTCSPQERQEVERMAAQFAEVRAALQQVELDLESLSSKLAVPTPPDLRGRVIGAVNQAAATANSGGSGVNNPPSSIFGSSFLLALAVTTCLGLLGSYYFYKQSNDKEALLLQERSKLADCETQTANFRALERQLVLLNDPQTTRFEIVPLAPDAAPQTAVVYSNNGQGQCLLSVAAMGQAPADKSFQLWALVDGTPVSMGVLDAVSSADGFVELPCEFQAQGYAISLEPKGGSPTPTQVIMMGTAG